MRSLLLKLSTVLGLVAMLSGSVLAGDAGAAALPPVANRSGFAPTSSMMLWSSDAELARGLDSITATGAKWVRFDFDWQSAEPVQGSYNWSHIDRVVKAARARRLNVLATLAYTPAWARPAGTTDKNPPTDPATFAKFAGDAVRRYMPMGVKHWEIWNEPNIVNFWQPKPDPAGYAQLLKAAFKSMRSVDREAYVITGGTAPAGDSPDGLYVNAETFLTKVYAAGAKRSFNAVGHHPYNFPYGPLFVHPMNAFAGTTPALHAIMVASGEGGKKIWATEFGAPTGTAGQAVSEERQASMVTEGWDQWTKWSYTGPIFWYGERDAGDDIGYTEHNFGMVRRDFSAKPALAEVTRVMKLAEPVSRSLY